MPDNTAFDITEVQAERLLITMRYRRLYQEAYGYPASQKQIDTAVEIYYMTLMDVTLALAEMVDENDGLKEVCEFADIPDWMMAGAPNPETHRRWVITGRI
jgi:hypothetical protein